MDSRLLIILSLRKAALLSQRMRRKLKSVELKKNFPRLDILNYGIFIYFCIFHEPGLAISGKRRKTCFGFPWCIPKIRWRILYSLELEIVLIFGSWRTNFRVQLVLGISNVVDSNKWPVHCCYCYFMNKDREGYCYVHIVECLSL